MQTQLKRGFLEASVLALLARGDSYGYGIVREAPAALELTESTLYPVLRRLAKDGCLREYKSEHNGRLRKYYSITDAGRDRLEEFLADAADIESVLDFIRKGVQQ